MQTRHPIAVMSETVDWNPFGQKTIRKCTLYSPMCWRTAIDFTKNVACISQYGGLIATAWDESQGSRSAGNRPDVTIYNAAGKEISSLRATGLAVLFSDYLDSTGRSLLSDLNRWNSGILIGIGWTRSDELLCLQEDGQVLIYDVFMQFQRSFTMGMECRENKVMEYEVFASQHGTGLAVMNGLYRFFIVNNVDEPKVRILADVPGLRSTPPSSWCVLPSSRSSKVLATNDSDIYLLDQGGLCSQHTPTDLNATPSSYIAMAVSVDGKHLVLYMNSGALWMGSSDFQEKYCEFNTNIGSRPKQLLWLCNSFAGSSAKLSERDVAVVVYWPKMLLVVGPKKDWIRYAVEEDIHIDSGLGSAVLSADVDGVRIVTANRHEFLQHVPSSVESIFKIGSMSPGSLLKCAAQEYNHQSEKADEYLRMLLDNGQLPEAVEKCITAASAEFQPRLQKTLLSAASFGKSFAPSLHLTEMFVDACQMLRILNAVRDFNIGISLTAAQFQSLTTHCLIDRLVHRRQFQLAFHICKYLKTPEDQGSSRILSHWACYKVQQTDVDDESIVRAIKQKLRSASGVSYADIAEKAVECGRKDLAIKLLDLERRASEQIRLLSKLGKHTLALEKAVLSGNTDLVYEAIAHLRERSSLSDFLVAIRQQPVAYKLYLKNCREQNERMLKDLHEQEDNFIELAHCHIQDSFGTFRAEERVTSLHSAMDSFNKARDEFSAKVTEEQLQLLREQTALEQETDSSFVELSLHDTLHALLITGQLKRAEQLRKQQKINDKRWWWLRIQALAEQGNFIELESFSKSKKSPIGYLPFIEVCMKHNAPSEVAKYISKVAQEKRVSALLKAGNVRAAADLALQSKNVMDLDMVLKRCGTEHREVSDQVQSAIIQLQRR